MLGRADAGGTELPGTRRDRGRAQHGLEIVRRAIGPHGEHEGIAHGLHDRLEALDRLVVLVAPEGGRHGMPAGDEDR